MSLVVHCYQANLIAENMFEFDLTGHENAILLCSQCHGAFDDAFDPGLFIIPSDLQQFIDTRNKTSKSGAKKPRLYFHSKLQEGGLDDSHGG